MLNNLSLGAALSMSALDELFNKVEVVTYSEQEPKPDMEALRAQWKESFYTPEDWDYSIGLRRDLSGKERQKRKKRRQIGNKSRNKNRK